MPPTTRGPTRCEPRLLVVVAAAVAAAVPAERRHSSPEWLPPVPNLRRFPMT